ncbi:uncharacterized protein TNCV_2531881 [Trichonephila clavipes]|nr:uncharacterized protein TNCV_2531881 [Trichonephila clavipes]
MNESTLRDSEVVLLVYARYIDKDEFAEEMVLCKSLETTTSAADIYATQGLLATDHVILNHGQVTWTTPELALSSPNYHTTPREDVSALDRFNMHRYPTRWVFSDTGLKLMTCMP